MKALKAEESLRNFAEHWVSEETTNQLIAAVKAAAWNEGYEAGSDDAHAWADVADGCGDFDDYEDTPNPYQEEAAEE